MATKAKARAKPETKAQPKARSAAKAGLRPGRKTFPKPAAAAPGARAAKKRRYQPHPMLAREEEEKVRLRKESGRSWEEWVEVARAKGPKDRKALKEWLQSKHGHSPNTAYWIAAGARSESLPEYGDPEPLVDALYSGAKAALRPLHEAVIDAALAFGDDVVVTACKTMVPIYRRFVFAELRPVAGAVEVQMSLGEIPPRGRLELAEGRAPGDRMTHRFVLRSPKDLGDEFRRWFSTAYAQGVRPMSRGPVEIDTPEDVARALRTNAAAARTWGDCTPAMRRDFVQWITSAKQDETRTRRIGLALERLASGKRRMY
jgi:hypothetical protein